MQDLTKNKCSYKILKPFQMIRYHVRSDKYFLLGLLSGQRKAHREEISMAGRCLRIFFTPKERESVWVGVLWCVWV